MEYRNIGILECCKDRLVSPFFSVIPSFHSSSIPTLHFSFLAAFWRKTLCKILDDLFDLFRKNLRPPRDHIVDRALPLLLSLARGRQPRPHHRATDQRSR